MLTNLHQSSSYYLTSVPLRSSKVKGSNNSKVVFIHTCTCIRNNDAGQHIIPL